jgi:hypothetical protein
MIRECKGHCNRIYPELRRTKPHYWDYLGYKLCNICRFLIKVNECNDIICQCCITKFRLKVRNPQQRQSLNELNNSLVNTKESKKVVRRVRRFLNDYSDIVCCYCGSKETMIDNIKLRPIWYKYKDSYYCRRCYGKVYYKTRKDKLIEQNLITVKTNSKYYRKK